MILCDADFLESHKRLTALCADFLHEISLRSNNKYSKYGYNFCNVDKVWLSLRRYSRKSQSLNKFLLDVKIVGRM
jgi:hypothetical protein